MIGGTKRMCEEFVLSNGLRVVAEPLRINPSVSVGLWIGAGSDVWKVRRKTVCRTL